MRLSPPQSSSLKKQNYFSGLDYLNILTSLALVFLFNSALVFANAKVSITELQALAKQKELSSHTQWLALLHFNRGGTLHSRKQSYIQSDTFFLAAQGKINAEAELQESIAVLFDEQQKEKRCSYIARFHWLSTQLEQENYLNGIQHCEQFLQTSAQVQAERLVLVFPSSYLNNPSSLFGHTLLRIDPKAENNEAVILNWAINFGARFTENDGAFAYAFKGISGLYSGQFFVVPYAQKIKEYNQIENRDIWEYPLNFTAQEVNFLLEHLWELREVDFSYYFFDENCSYRLLELLEVARPELKLSEKFRLTEIPLNTVKLLDEHQLIESSTFRPSKERLLKHQFEQLSPTQQKQAITLSQDLKISEGSEFIKLSTVQQQKIFYSSYQYLRYTQARKERDPDIAKRSLDLLKKINSLAIESPFDAEQNLSHSLASIPPSILKSHDSHRLSLGAGKIRNHDFFQSFSLRMSYHDLLDNAWGYSEGAHIEGADIRIKRSEDDIKIDQLKLVEVISLNPRSHFNKDLSWMLSIKAERSDENNEHLHSIISGGRGLAWQYKNIIHYQMLVPRAEFSPDFEDHGKAGLGFKIGLLHNSGKHPVLIEYHAIKLDALEIKHKLDFMQQVELAQNHALRFELHGFKQQDVEWQNIELKYLFYF